MEEMTRWFLRGGVSLLCIAGWCGGHTTPEDVQLATPVAIAAPVQRPVDLYAILLHRIGACESSGDVHGPLSYREPNLHGSTASGAYQILNGTWKTWQAAFRPDLHYRRAMQAPPVVQDEIAMDALKAYGVQPWVSSRKCWR